MWTEEDRGRVKEKVNNAVSKAGKKEGKDEIEEGMQTSFSCPSLPPPPLLMFHCPFLFYFKNERYVMDITQAEVQSTSRFPLALSPSLLHSFAL